MLEIVIAGGWLMVPIIACSVIAAAIILERLWTLQEKRVIPKHVVSYVREWMQHNELEPEHLQRLHESSPLGQILAAGLASRFEDREIVRERIEDSGRHVVHELERYLNPLHTIAAISPLLGLLGTVIGMIKVFASIMENGVGNPASLAGGISEALITTAAGLSVAIPALIGHRYLRSRIDGLVVKMEKEAWRFLESLPSRDAYAYDRRDARERMKRSA
ncbi:MAG: MotA/TolQ/ExbB proton channel family protein [Gammaproteobacteria bacterium]|nr:biopolymer transporter ExbB [Gammaproteobacteria bacterium]